MDRCVLKARLLLIVMAFSACTPEQRIATSRTMAEQNCRRDYPGMSDRYFACLREADSTYRRPTEQKANYQGMAPGSSCNCPENH